MRTAVELADVHHIVLVLEHGSLQEESKVSPARVQPGTWLTHLVIVHIQIVWSREDGDERREPRGLAFSVHSVARVLCLVCPDN